MAHNLKPRVSARRFESCQTILSVSSGPSPTPLGSCFRQTPQRHVALSHVWWSSEQFHWSFFSAILVIPSCSRVVVRWSCAFVHQIWHFAKRRGYQKSTEKKKGKDQRNLSLYSLCSFFLSLFFFNASFTFFFLLLYFFNK